MRLIFLPLLLIFVLSACNPDEYLLNRQKDYRIYGFKMSGIDDVKKIGDNAVSIDSNSVTSLKVQQLTNFLADFTIKLYSGSGIRFYFRTARHNFSGHDNLSFNYTTNGSYIIKNNTIIDTIPGVKANIGLEERIRILNDASNYMILVDCDTVYTGRTELPNTEYIIVETHRNTRATLFGIQFEEVYNSDLPYFEEKIFRPSPDLN